jgi:hypothetical protein
MNKKLAFLIVLLIHCVIINSQTDEIKRTLYEGKIKDLTSKLEVTFWSSDIIEYHINVTNMKNDTLFKQRGFAISPSNSLFAKHGMEFGEQIGPDMTHPVSAKPFSVFCNCDSWINIKVSKDYSFIQVDCGQDLLNKLFMDYSIKNRYTQILGYFYPKEK